MKPKNPAAVRLGRMGGKARWADTTPEERTEAAKQRASAAQHVQEAAEVERCPCGRYTMRYAVKYHRAKHVRGECGE